MLRPFLAAFRSGDVARRIRAFLHKMWHYFVRGEESTTMLAANELAEVILARSGPWTDAMRLQKLLYYVQAWHLAITDEPVFAEKFKAYKDGPVVPDVRHARMEQSTRRATSQHPELVQIDELTSSLVDLVIASYGSMSGEELSALTHVERPWLDARGDLPADASSSTPISNESMAQYYRAHRMLGGRTAADLAAGGVLIRDTSVPSAPIDVDALFESLDSSLADPGVNEWGSSNLVDDAGYLEHLRTRRAGHFSAS